MRGRGDVDLLSGSRDNPPVCIGIDLGTGFSRVGVWNDGDVLIVPNTCGKLATPSCIAFTDESILIGEDAAEQAEANPGSTIYAPQRLLGSRFSSPWVQWCARCFSPKLDRDENDRPVWSVTDGGKERRVGVEEAVSILLAHQRRQVERHVKAPVVGAVVTIPAQFGKCQCEALARACRTAGLEVLELVKAPTAAGIAFCLTNPIESRRHVLVVDMGASYFNFVLLHVEGPEITERAAGTDYVDLDSCLLRFCLRDLKERFSVEFSTDNVRDQLSRQRLRRVCELAKKSLSQWSQTHIDVQGLAGGIDYSLLLSRGQFEDACRHDIEPLLNPIDYCLEDCGVSRSEVDVILVGGSARIPRIRRAFREFFYGRPPREVLRPDHAAVLGAAVFAAAHEQPLEDAAAENAHGERVIVGAATESVRQIPVDVKRLRLHQVGPCRSDDVADDAESGMRTPRSRNICPKNVIPFPAKSSCGHQFNHANRDKNAAFNDVHAHPPSPPPTDDENSELTKTPGQGNGPGAIIGADSWDSADSEDDAPRDEAEGRTMPLSERGMFCRAASKRRMA